jgi:hypothetical protein
MIVVDEHSLSSVVDCEHGKQKEQKEEANQVQESCAPKGGDEGQARKKKGAPEKGGHKKEADVEQEEIAWKE